MGNFVKAAKKNEIADGKGLVVNPEGQGIALFNIAGNFFAIENTCKHRGGPLGEGGLEGNTVTCPLHGWEYDVTTGACLTNPAVKQKTYTVKVEDEDILIEI